MDYMSCHAESDYDSPRFIWLKASGKNPEAAGRNFCGNTFRIHDCDNCGTVRYEFAVETESGVVFFSVEHSWWWADWESDNRFVDNEFEIAEIASSKILPSKRRDWIIV